MPRLRPLKTKEEIEKVPVDQPVMIALEPEGVVELDNNTDEATETKKVEPKKKIEAPEENSELVSLREQLEAMRKASDAQIAQYQKQLQETQAQFQENELRLARSQNQAQDAEYQAILNAIGAAESEAESAQTDIARATEAADAKMVAEASRRLARAEGRLAQLEDGKAALEAQKSREAREAKEDAERRKSAPQQPQNQTPEQFIDQMPNLLPSQRDWLKAHTELVVNTNKNLRLQGAHAEAVDLNLQPGTQKYFDHLETRLGYKSAEPEDDNEDDERAQIVSAPPSKQSTSPSTGRQSNTTRITLTPEQREIARMSGISEIDYARGLQKLQDLKANGGYQ